MSEGRQAEVQVIREALADHVEVTSLRTVARQIGMSPTGLRKLLNGTEPYSPTLRRLRQWMVEYGPWGAGEVPDTGSAVEQLRAAVATAGRDAERLAVLADADRLPPEVLSELLAALDALHRAWGGGGLVLESGHVSTAVGTEVAA